MSVGASERSSRPGNEDTGGGNPRRSEPEARSRRRSIEVDGLHHGGAPIPLAARVGPLVVSGGILGQNPGADGLPETVAEEVAYVFANVRRVMAAAGGGPGDIVKMTFFVRDRSCRPLIDSEWVAMFPDPADRPARHSLLSDLPPAVHVQCELIAFVGAERGTSL